MISPAENRIKRAWAELDRSVNGINWKRRNGVQHSLSRLAEGALRSERCSLFKHPCFWEILNTPVGYLTIFLQPLCSYTRYSPTCYPLSYTSSSLRKLAFAPPTLPTFYGKSASALSPHQLTTTPSIHTLCVGL